VGMVKFSLCRSCRIIVYHVMIGGFVSPRQLRRRMILCLPSLCKAGRSAKKFLKSHISTFADFKNFLDKWIFCQCLRISQFRTQIFLWFASLRLRTQFFADFSLRVNTGVCLERVERRPNFLKEVFLPLHPTVKNLRIWDKNTRKP
jgi:hypothetical protein